MAVAFGSSALDSESLSEALVKVGPIANSVGFSFEDTVAALARFADRGVKGSVAGVALAKILSTLKIEGGDVTEKFKELTSSTITVEKGTERFQERAGKYVPILSEASEELETFSNNLLDSTGAADKARKAIEDTTDGALRKLKSALEEAGISIGQVLLPVVTKVVVVLTRLTNSFSSLSPAAKTAIVLVAGLAAAVGPLVFLLGAFAQSIVAVTGAAAAMGLTVTAMLGPLGLLAGAIGLVGMAVFANETRKANEELRKQNELTRSRSKLERENRNDLELSKQKLQEVIDLAKEGEENGTFGIISEATLQRLNEADNQYGLLFRNIRTASRETGEDVIAQLEEELVKLDELAAKRKADADERARAAKQAQFEAEQELAVTGDLVTKVDELLRSEENRESALKEINKQRKEEAGQLAAMVAYVDEMNRLMNLQVSDRGISPVSVDGQLTDEAAFDAEFGDIDMSAFDTMEESLAASADELDRVRKGMVSIQQSADGVERLKKVFGNGIIGEDGELQVEALSASFERLGRAAAANLQSILSGAMTVQQVIGNFVRDFIIKMLAMATANYITAALSPTSADNLATGGVSGAIKAAAGPALISSLFGGIPAFAEGGAVTSATLALVGEKPGSRGEAIIPFEKMGDFIGQVLPEGFGANNVVVTGRIKGNDIAISNTRGGRGRGRSF